MEYLLFFILGVSIALNVAMAYYIKKTSNGGIDLSSIYDDIMDDSLDRIPEPKHNKQNTVDFPGRTFIAAAGKRDKDINRS